MVLAAGTEPSQISNDTVDAIMKLKRYSIIIATIMIGRWCSHGEADFKRLKKLNVFILYSRNKLVLTAL